MVQDGWVAFDNDINGLLLALRACGVVSGLGVTANSPEDMSVNDISKALDRSVSWTKVNLMRGRRTLEEQMNDAAGRSEAYG